MNKFVFFLFILLFVSYDSRAADLIKINENGKFSAQLENVKLVELTTFIQEKYGIAFKNQDTSLLQSQVTVSFKNIDVEQMLKKILVKKNFVFKYNNQGKVIEVTLLTTENNKTPAQPNQSSAKNQELPLASDLSPETHQKDKSVQKEITNSQVHPQSPAPEFEQKNDKTSQQDKIISFKVVPNSPPPVTDQNATKNQAADIITSFKVIPNAPPPGK